MLTKWPLTAPYFRVDLDAGERECTCASNYASRLSSEHAKEFLSMRSIHLTCDDFK